MRLGNFEREWLSNNPSVRSEWLISREPCGGRSKDVSAIEGVAFRLQLILSIFNLTDFDLSFLLEHIGEQSIIRGDKVITRTSCEKWASFTPYPRIDDRDMHGTVGKVPVTGLPHVGPVFYGMRGNPMAQIDDRRLRIDGEDHPLHARHEPISIAEIGQERDEP